MFKSKQTLLAILIMVAISLGGQWLNKFSHSLQGEGLSESVQTTQMPIIISPRAQTHILYGDQRGGGHVYGANKPCKSEFPANWNEDKILSTINKIAANDNIDWRQQENGYFTGQQMVDSVKVRVVLDRERDGVVTAYPINVPRNPCNGAANDNKRR